jgi:urease accessory protein
VNARPRLYPLIALCVVSRVVPVLAHVEGGEVAGLGSGLLHPVSGLDHVVAMIAVGVWGAQLGAPALWLLPVTFPLVMAFGGMAGLIGVPLPGVEFGIALSAIVLGALVVFEAKSPIWLAVLIVGVFAIFHGHAHGTELPDGASGLLYSIGFVVSTGTLHGVGIILGLVHRWSAGRVVLRVAGAGVAATGAVFLAGAL